MRKFPDGFLWGSATSAYQVEGDNKYADWRDYEQKGLIKEACGYACRHYQFFKEDFTLAKSLNHNAHRLSIEWSRIEPAEGEFCDKEIQHYIQVIDFLKALNIEPVVTLHHFTNPLWFTQMGGWESAEAVKYFSRYICVILEALASKVRFWVTINEPMIYIYNGYVLGIWPPLKRSFLAARRVENNLIASHLGAYRLIHEFYKKKKLKEPFVSIAKNIQGFRACTDSFRDKLALYLRNRFFNLEFIETLIRKHSLDFIGINYYSRNLIETHGWGLKNLLLDACTENHHPLEKNSLGWDIYPEGLFDILIRLKDYALPVFILENGICIDDDRKRWDYIYRHLEKLYQAIEQGVVVLGYLYWSLLDNFEWDKGFAPRFGLVEVDYNTYKRIVRPSARDFALVCEKNAIA